MNTLCSLATRAFTAFNLGLVARANLPLLIALAVAILAAVGSAAEPELEIVRDGRGNTIAIRNHAEPALHGVKPAAAPVAKADPVAARDAAIARAGALLAPLAVHFRAEMADLKTLGAETNALQMSHVHYRQQYGGVPVLGSEVIVHLTPGGALSTVNGRTLDLRGSPVATVPRINAEAAVAVAIAIAEAPLPNGAKPEPLCCGQETSDAAGPIKLQALTKPRLWLYNQVFLLNSEETPTHLVWEVVIGAPGGKWSETFYIDAIDSRLVERHSNVPNKAAYLTAMGGTFNGRTVTGLGLAKVEQIWNRALTTYYADAETFNGAYVALRQACADLYPASDVAELTAALQAVELDQPPLPAPPFQITNAEATTPGQPGATVQLTWNSHAGKNYRIQTSPDLVAWTYLTPAIPAQGERTTHTDPIPTPTAPRRFYQVEQQ